MSKVKTCVELAVQSNGAFRLAGKMDWSDERETRQWVFRQQPDRIEALSGLKALSHQNRPITRSRHGKTSGADVRQIERRRMPLLNAFNGELTENSAERLPLQ